MSRAEPAGTAARAAALRLLDAVLCKGLPLEAALDGAARDLDRPDDRAFAHAIAAETLRRLPDLDALIDGATRKRLPDDAKARFALRIALVQALAMGTPPHAAISTALPLVDGGPRRLVHGVFGSLMRRKATLPDVPILPETIARRWRDNWGDDVIAAASRLLAVPPPLDLSFPPDAPPKLEGVSLMPGHLRLPARTAVSGLAGYHEGQWWVQDVAASIPARLLGKGEGRTALDLCAAPGGKTMQLAASGFRVAAVDASESRLARLSDNLARTGLAADIVQADMLVWAPAAPADAILLDAPCSATGIFRRHPDVLHRFRPKALAELAEGQSRMLARAADWLRPGGALVYSVCSLEPEEGEQAVERFLAARPDYAPDPVRPGELAPQIPLRNGRVRLLPGTFGAEGGADGFFVARFRRLSGG
ncbi:MAG TPA: RsmB/NOP family class I SAM-dependent RNA methyltransferase [Allosphingosinicella sp.]|nr:RsmB/NOP family class I SAM-dependent RNA methyltransferase [Allosphingosinicella sp.]